MGCRAGVRFCAGLPLPEADSQELGGGGRCRQPIRDGLHSAVRGFPWQFPSCLGVYAGVPYLLALVSAGISLPLPAKGQMYIHMSHRS